MQDFPESRLRLWPLVMLGASIAVVYGSVFTRLVQDWSTDDNYSHGFLILPIAAYFAYEQRQKLFRAPVRPATIAGLVMIVSSLLLLALGTLASELFVTRVSFIGTVAGSILFLYGFSYFRILLFPLAFLFLMIPIPAIIFNQIAFPLQLLASDVGENVMKLAGVPVLREGNVIILPRTTLEVAEACSGIRSLITLLSLGIVFGYFMDARTSVRVLLAAATIPIAIITNALRVAGTGIAAHYWSPAAAQGFFHTFSGWLVFATAFALLIVVAKLLKSLMGRPTAQGQAPTPQYS